MNTQKDSRTDLIFSLRDYMAECCDWQNATVTPFGVTDKTESQPHTQLLHKSTWKVELERDQNPPRCHKPSCMCVPRWSCFSLLPHVSSCFLSSNDKYIRYFFASVNLSNRETIYPRIYRNINYVITVLRPLEKNLLREINTI